MPLPLKINLKMKLSSAISGLAIFGTCCVALAFVPSAQVGPVTKIAGSSFSAASSARTSPLFAGAANGDLPDLVTAMCTLTDLI